MTGSVSQYELKTRLASTTNAKDRLDALVHLVNACLGEGKHEEVVKYGREAYDRAQLTGDLRNQADAGAVLSSALHNLGRYGEALQVASEVHEVLLKLDDTESLAKNATTIGMVYREIADYPKALTWYFDALACHEQAGDEIGVARVRNNIGNVYLEEGDTANALKHYQQVLEYVERTGHEQGIGIALNNIGETHNRCGQFKDALACLGRALEVRTRIGQEQKAASVLVNTADAHLGLGAIEAALSCAARACDLAATAGMVSDHIDALVMLGRVHMARQDYAQARDALGHAEEHAREVQARQRLVGIHARQSELHELTGMFAEALASARSKSTLQEELHQEALAAVNDTHTRLLETTKAQTRMESQLKIAGEMQMRIVPDIAPLASRHEVDLYAHLRPAREVGGDFYDVLFLDQDRLYLCVGDVSDKDVGAALFMAVTHTLLRAYARAGSSPDEILAQANRELVTNNPKSMYVTVWLGIFTISTGTLEYADAGHCPPLLVADGKADWLARAKKPPLGLFPDVTYASRATVVRPGDALCVYTDGVTEAFDKEAVMFTDERLYAAVQAHPHGSARALAEHVLRSVEQFAAGAPQSDDITLLSLVYRGK